MAKSFFEPKKIVRYANNQQVIEGGLGSAPTPRRVASATRPVPKTQAIPAEAQKVSAPAPAPTPPPAPAPTPAPPIVGETRAFLFDGATELTSSWDSTGGNQTWAYMLHGTFTPGWSQSDTGSYVILSIGTPDSDDYRQTIYFERTSGSDGYRDFVVTEATSGSSAYNRRKTELNASPYFYSGSEISSNVYLQVYSQFGYSGYTLENGAQNSRISGSLGKLKRIVETSTTSPSGRARIANNAWNSNDHVISIGGYHSGSANYYTGSIANLAFYKVGNGSYGQNRSKTMPNLTNDRSVAWYWQFEGNTVAVKGTNLDVLGTETYVSSSI